MACAATLSRAPCPPLSQAVAANNGLCEDDARWFFTQILFAVGEECTARLLQQAAGRSRAAAQSGEAVLGAGLLHCPTGWLAPTCLPAGAQVDYCHRMGVANRDLKLENTLLDASPRPLVKLADFG